MWVGWGGEGGREEENSPQVKTQVTSCPQMILTMQLGQRDIILEFQANNTQLVHFTGANVSIMALQGCKSSPQKSRPLESGHRRHGVGIAIEYSFKLGQKHEFKFLCKHGWFLQRQSRIHIYILMHGSIKGSHWVLGDNYPVTI